MKSASAFGRSLQKTRLAAGLSQLDLATSAKLDRTFISLLERGERQPSLETIFKLSKVLKIRPSKLVQDTERLMRSRTGRNLIISSRRL